MSTTLPITPDELLTTTRAVRRRIDCDRPVEREVIEELLTIALQAPTASNMQPWSFVVVTDPDTKAAIGEWYRKSWAAYEEMPFAAGNLPYEEPDRRSLQQRVMSSAAYLAKNYERMPVFIIPCLGMRPEAIDLPQSLVQATLYSSVIQAAWSIQLAARARGLGSCWTTLHLLHEREIGEIAGIPPASADGAADRLGYCKGTRLQVGPRARTLSTKVHWERSVGAPAPSRGLHEASRRYGQRSLASFGVTPRLARGGGRRTRGGPRGGGRSSRGVTNPPDRSSGSVGRERRHGSGAASTAIVTVRAR